MKVDIAIMTIREDEFTAIRRHFQTKRQRIPNGRTYLIGEVKTEKQTYTIAIARCSEQGTDASQRLAHYIIHNLDPRLILVVGIAGGVPHDEFTLGDVVVSSRIVNPNIDAWHSDGTTDYMTRGGPSHPLVDDIVSLLPGEPLLTGWTNTIQQERPALNPEMANITGDNEWREKVHQSLRWHFGEEQNRSRVPTFTTGPILSSNHLMKDSARLKELLKTHRSIFAVEMEAAGVYEAAQGIDYQYPVMAIRSISDIIGLQRDRRWTEYACRAAAAFTYAFIMTDPLDLPLNAANSQRSIASSELFSAQFRVSELSLDAQPSGWRPTQTTTDNPIPTAPVINIRGSWQEITNKHTRIWSLTQSGNSITGKGIHKSLYHTNTVAIVGIIDGHDIRINAYITENNCIIDYLIYLDDKQTFMSGEWISRCNGEKGIIKLFKSK
jgi:nucleoside phosphorylase